MTISLIIPAYNEERYIGACLEAALAEGKGRFSQIIVVDNASSDGTAATARRYSGVTVIREEKRGTNAARACGLALAASDLVAYIDADTRLPEGWIEKVLATFESDKRVVSLSGPYRYYDGTPLSRALVSGMWWLTAPLTSLLVGYMVLGGNFVARRSALLAAGGFDTSYLFYGDDTDVARRLSTQGKVLFRMNFYNDSSLRRFSAQGLLRTSWLYALNFIWPVLFRKPYTRGADMQRGRADSSTIKAIAATLLFGIMGVYGWRTAGASSVLPLGIFYAALVLNTFFSVRLFGRVIPISYRLQILFDLALCGIYALLAFSFANPVLFLLTTALLFVCATAKYAYLLGDIPHPRLLKRKILIDLLGAAGALFSLFLFGFGYTSSALWIFAGGFLFANVLLFTKWPLYKADHEISG